MELDLPAESALVLVDLQNDFLHPSGMFGDRCIPVEEVLPGVRVALDHARMRALPVVWVTSTYGDRGAAPEGAEEEADRGVLRLLEGTHRGARECCAAGSFGERMHSEVAELVAPEDLQVTKHFYNPFKGTDLLHLLGPHLVELVVAGVTGTTCVRATVEAAMRMDRVWAVTVLSDAVGVRGDSGAHRKAMRQLREAGAEVLGSCEWVQRWEMQVLPSLRADRSLLGLGDGGTALHCAQLVQDVPTVDRLFGQVAREVQWGTMWNQGHQVPRLVALQGDLRHEEEEEEEEEEKEEEGGLAVEDKDLWEPLYRHPADAQPELVEWTPAVRFLRDRVQELLGAGTPPLNHALIQRYRTRGKDSIGQHSDKTLDIVPGSLIVNVSLGCERVMLLTPKEKEKEKEEEEEGGPQKRSVRVPLPHLSVFVLDLDTNRTWKHGVPADGRQFPTSSPEMYQGGERVSLTFRSIGTFRNRRTGEVAGQGAPRKVQQQEGRREEEEKDEELEARDMLLGFSRENNDPHFVWEEAYGRGFRVVNFRTLNGDPTSSGGAEAMQEERRRILDLVEQQDRGGATGASSSSMCEAGQDPADPHRRPRRGDFVAPVPGERTLYYVRASIPSWRAMMLLHELQLDFTPVRMRVMVTPKDTRHEDFLRLNPRGKTPTVVEPDGTVLHESLALLVHYCLRYGEGRPDMMSPRALVRMNESNVLLEKMGPLEKLFLNLQDLSQDQVDELVLVEQRVLEELARWEQYLLEAEAPGFIAGEGLSPSVADCAFFPVLAYLQYHGLELFPRYPALAGYADRMMQLPSSLAAYPSHWSPFSNRKNLFARLHSVARR